MKQRKRLKADPEKVREFVARGRRNSEMERGELTPDPEKVRAFQQRGRESGAKSLRESARAGARARAELKEGPLDAGSWRREVYTASGGRCIVTNAEARDADDRRFHAHHCVPKDELRALGLHAHVWDPRNGVWVTARVHMRHEAAFSRIPRELLPASVWEFAQEMDRLLGTEWATYEVERTHPATGISRIRDTRSS